jgi:uncharacterized SAM-binding protein YcdF (DUF218 family)
VAAVLIVLALLALRNAVEFYVLTARETIRPAVPIPLSLLVSLLLAWAAYGAARPTMRSHETRPPRRPVVAFIATAALFTIVLPLAQMLFFGTTDYRRPADAAVVFGARAYADGRPSHALADRVRTACELYNRGLVRKLVFSGGPGDGHIHETESMRRMAITLGVPDEAILLDPAGVNTRATVRNTCAELDRLNAGRVLVVSHAYHLPRVKMCYQRAGREVYTVPAKETYVLRAMPRLVLREVVAQCAYYLAPLAGVEA